VKILSLNNNGISNRCVWYFERGECDFILFGKNISNRRRRRTRNQRLKRIIYHWMHITILQSFRFSLSLNFQLKSFKYLWKHRNGSNDVPCSLFCIQGKLKSTYCNHRCILLLPSFSTRPYVLPLSF